MIQALRNCSDFPANTVVTVGASYLALVALALAALATPPSPVELGFELVRVYRNVLERHDEPCELASPLRRRTALTLLPPFVACAWAESCAPRIVFPSSVMRVKQILLSGFKSYLAQESFDDFHPRSNVLGTPRNAAYASLVTYFSWAQRVGQVQPHNRHVSFASPKSRPCFFSLAVATMEALFSHIGDDILAIRFLLSSEFQTLRAEDRRALLHVRFISTFFFFLFCFVII